MHEGRRDATKDIDSRRRFGTDHNVLPMLPSFLFPLRRLFLPVWVSDEASIEKDSGSGRVVERGRRFGFVRSVSKGEESFSVGAV